MALCNCQDSTDYEPVLLSSSYTDHVSAILSLAARANPSFVCTKVFLLHLTDSSLSDLLTLFSLVFDSDPCGGLASFLLWAAPSLSHRLQLSSPLSSSPHITHHSLTLLSFSTLPKSTHCCNSPSSRVCLAHVRASRAWQSRDCRSFLGRGMESHVHLSP